MLVLRVEPCAVPVKQKEHLERFVTFFNSYGLITQPMERRLLEYIVGGVGTRARVEQDAAALERSRGRHHRVLQWRESRDVAVFDPSARLQQQSGDGGVRCRQVQRSLTGSTHLGCDIGAVLEEQ